MAGWRASFEAGLSSGQPKESLIVPLCPTPIGVGSFHHDTRWLRFPRLGIEGHFRRTEPCIEEGGRSAGPRSSGQKLKLRFRNSISTPPGLLFTMFWGRLPRRDVLNWSFKLLQCKCKTGTLGWRNAITPSESCGKTLVGSWTRWERPRLLRTFSLTMPPSLHVRREVNGSRQWFFLGQWKQPKWIQMWSSTVLPSVLVGRVVSGSRHCACLKKWKELKQHQMSSPTMRQSVPVRREVNGSMHWCSLVLCRQPMRTQMWSATVLPSVLVRRGVNGIRHWTCSGQCRRPKLSQMSSATTPPSVHARREASGSMPSYFLKKWTRRKWKQVWSATMRPWALVRRVVNGNRPYHCLRQCSPQKFNQTWSPTVCYWIVGILPAKKAAWAEISTRRVCCPSWRGPRHLRASR